MTRRPRHAPAPDTATQGRAFGLGPRARLLAGLAAVGVGVAAATLAGGGSTVRATHAQRTLHAARSGRASRPAPAGTEHGPTLAARRPARGGAAAPRPTGGLGSSSQPIRTAGTTYGYVPAWLGRQTVPVDRIVTATPARPWLAVQGDTVRVRLAGAQALVTLVGPQVPEQGHFPVPRTTPCAFTVTIARASAPIRLNPRQFWVVDEQGRLHSLQVTDAGGGAPAVAARPGRTTRLRMTAVLPVGQGDIAWAPVAGAGAVIRWDFDVEID